MHVFDCLVDCVGRLFRLHHYSPSEKVLGRIDTGEMIAVYASRRRSILKLKFLRRALEACYGKPVMVVDRGPWHP